MTALSLPVMLVLNAISLFYHNLSYPSDKPVGVIEDWTKGVYQGVVTSMSTGGRITSSATLVTKAKLDKKVVGSLASSKPKKAAKAPAKLFLTASDEDFPDIRIAKSEVLTPAASVSRSSTLSSILTMFRTGNR